MRGKACRGEIAHRGEAPGPGSGGWVLGAGGKPQNTDPNPGSPISGPTPCTQRPVPNTQDPVPSTQNLAPRTTPLEVSMSLIKKQSMTDKNRAAHQRNGRQSRGAATAEGKERSRAAHLRHGFYSQRAGGGAARPGRGPGRARRPDRGHARGVAARQRFPGAHRPNAWRACCGAWSAPSASRKAWRRGSCSSTKNAARRWPCKCATRSTPGWMSWGA